VVTYLAAAVLIEHGSACAEISVALEASDNGCNDAPSAGENVSGKGIMPLPHLAKERQLPRLFALRLRTSLTE
jgi:hypothetical protein